jgi:two-component system sensor kinase FixL
MELQVGEFTFAGCRYFTGFVRDVTERQEAERRIQDLPAELLHASRLGVMGQMASTMAHELNQPLTAGRIIWRLGGNCSPSEWVAPRESMR